MQVEILSFVQPLMKQKPCHLLHLVVPYPQLVYWPKIIEGSDMLIRIVTELVLLFSHGCRVGSLPVKDPGSSSSCTVE